MNPKFKKFWPLFILLPIVFVAALGYGVMYLWNWLMPVIFGLTTITFWQAVGLFVLSKILFSGFGGMKGKQGRRNNQCTPKNRMFDKFKMMSPEEREAFVNKVSEP
jgi:hypothetical protein